MNETEATDTAIGEAQPVNDAQPAREADLQRILTIEVPIIVRLAARTMLMSDVLRLAPGSVIEFAKNVEEKLDLMINNKCVGAGVAVKVGENFGLRVTHIGPLDETIKALGRQGE